MRICFCKLATMMRHNTSDCAFRIVLVSTKLILTGEFASMCLMHLVGRNQKTHLVFTAIRLL